MDHAHQTIWLHRIHAFGELHHPRQKAGLPGRFSSILLKVDVSEARASRSSLSDKREIIETKIIAFGIFTDLNFVNLKDVKGIKLI